MFVTLFAFPLLLSDDYAKTKKAKKGRRGEKKRGKEGRGKMRGVKEKERGRTMHTKQEGRE